MNTFLQKNGKAVFISVLALIILIVVYYSGKGKGTRAQKEKMKESAFVPLPAIAGVNGADIRRITLEIHADLIANALTPRNVQVYRDIARLNNLELTALYNDYTLMYFDAYNETLTQAIDNDYYFAWTEVGNLVAIIQRNLSNANLR